MNEKIFLLFQEMFPVENIEDSSLRVEDAYIEEFYKSFRPALNAGGQDKSLK